MLVSFLQSAIAMGIVYLYGCIGEIITEKVGHLNLGIPGIMCLGALGGVVGANIYFAIFGVTHIIWILMILFTLIFSIIFAAFGGLIYAFFTISLQANQNVTGLVLTTFGVGLMRFIGARLNTSNLNYASNTIKTLFKNYDKLGWFGQLFLSYGFYVYLAIILAILVSLFLRKTRVGLFVRAIGESPQTADAQGINITKYKYIFILVGAAIAGIGGLYFVLDRSGGTTFTEAPIEAFGWMAVALVIFSIWRPGLGIIGSFAFGALSILPLYLHLSPVSLKAFDALPYLLTVVVLIVTSIIGKKNTQPPAALGVNYFREER